MGRADSVPSLQVTSTGPDRVNPAEQDTVYLAPDSTVSEVGVTDPLGTLGLPQPAEVRVTPSKQNNNLICCRMQI